MAYPPLPLGPLNRPLSALERQLRANTSLHMPSRAAALGAVTAMMDDATRSRELLRQAQVEAARSPGASLTTGRAAVLAREAYAARTSAEVAKYRAAYALLAEDEANKAAGARSLAARVKTSREHGPLVQKVRYHEKRRDLMLQAAEATSRALKRIPPLPAHVTKEAGTLPSNRQVLTSPTLGWRAPKFATLTGNFFPDDVRAAASGLGAVEATSAPAWWSALQQSILYGTKAAGAAAAEEGTKVATQNPTGGAALNVGSGILDTLSKMVGGSASEPARSEISTAGPNWDVIALVGGGLALGGYLLWRRK